MENSLDLIREFINSDYLQGDIENLKSFDFAKLEGVEKYDGCSKGNYDPDDSKLAKAIYYVIWKDKLPELNTIEDIGTGKNYRGDTINTFNTLFGKKIDSFHRIEKYSNNEPLKKYVKEDFYKTYQTIGNFMLMPNRPLEKNTINLYRGGFYGWRDYFDRFLYELNECLTNDAYDNPIFKNLIVQNEFYFEKFNNIQKISEVNFLEPYLNSKCVKELFFKEEPMFLSEEGRKDKHNIPLSEESKQEYTEFAECYISKVTEIINYRADKIIEELKSKGLGEET